MCFSATASFVASGGLAVAGLASMRIASKNASKKQMIIAVIPLLFAIQQAFEGFQWLAIDDGRRSLFAGYGFIFFALILWPVYIPLLVYIFDRKKRDVSRLFLALGSLLATYFLFILFREPMDIRVLEYGIYYKIGRLFGDVTGTLYFIAICGVLLASSIKAFRIFGIATFASVFITTLFFRLTFTSTWCFFAGILSALIYVYIAQSRKNK